MKKAIINYLDMTVSELRLGLIVCCIGGCSWFFRELRHGSPFKETKKAQPVKQLPAEMEPKKLYPL